MPSIKISPSSALVTAGQALTLQATDNENKAVNVNWSLTPQLGSLVTATSGPAGPPAPQVPGSSATYIAPSIVQTAQTVAVTAATPTDTASITISLTPEAMSIVPPAVELHAGQKQQFMAIVASGAGEGESIDWILSPQVGELDEKGLYTAPDVIPDNGTLTITAACRHLGKQTSAKVTLTPEPWRGFGADLLACYLFLVFSVVFLMILLWPSEIPNIDTLKADQVQAQSNVDKKKLALQTGLGSATGKGTDTTTGSAQQKASDVLLDQLTAEDQEARADLDAATKKLRAATSPKVDTRMVKDFNREIDLLCLVLLAGALGSFLHMAQSFSDFTGNRTLKSSWVWWYCFLPFVGSGLALILYASLRGGLITAATTPTVKTADLNPYGLVAAAALAGMFSKAATKKLGEVFDTVFQSSKGTQTSDPLKPDAPGASSPAKPSAPAGGASSNK
jgi:hypothetical protein